MLKISASITFIVLFLILAINSIYAQNYTNSNNTTTNLKNTNNMLSLLSYKFEPFLLLNGTIFKDVTHDDKFSLVNFAIAAWIRTNQTNQTTLADHAHIVNKGGFNSDDKGKNMNYGIWLTKNGNIQGGFETELGKNFQVSSLRKYNDGNWHFILLSYDGSILRLDIDGKQISTKKTNGAIPDTTGNQPLRIGANSLDKDKFYSGSIDEVRIWNRGLTNSEIAEIYSNGTFNAIGQVHYQDFKSIFNIAVAADWGCDENAKKTAENIQSKNPEIVIAAGDLSYEEFADCWFEIIEPFKSKMTIAMGDHEYSDTSGGAIGIIDQYLKPLNLAKTYYSFDMNNVHVTVIDPHIDYGSTSDQYQFIENDLKTASTNPKIDWTFVVESRPFYTSLSYHSADSTIRDVFHPLFDKYGVDLVFSSENHNYQRTFPLKYNNNSNSSNPIIIDRNQTNYNGDYQGQIYLITGTAGRSLYEIKQQAPFVAKQDDKHFGFLNIDISGKTLKAFFYGNGRELSHYYYVDYQNNIIDYFTISKINESNNKENVNI